MFFILRDLLNFFAPLPLIDRTIIINNNNSNLNNKSKLKAQSSKPQLKTLKLSACHPEGEARRISCQLSEGFFADAQNDNEKVKTQKSKLKTTTQNPKTLP